MNYFGDYQIISPLSWGSFGKVHLVRSIKTNDNYAMKILKTKIDSFEILNLDPEISFLVLFQNHPNIVQTKDILFDP
jgi:serine/threonine protein kinase